MLIFYFGQISPCSEAIQNDEEEEEKTKDRRNDH